MARVATIAFAMALALCVVAPAAAQTISSVSLEGGTSSRTRGNDYLVSWTTTGSVPFVQMRICSNTVCTTQYGTTLTFANNSPYTLTMPNLAVSTSYFIEIASTAAPTTVKAYSSSFTVAAVPATITVTTPSSMVRGSMQLIQWAITAGTVTSVNITLRLSSTTYVVATNVDSTGSSPFYAYNVPPTMPNDSLYRLTIVANQYPATQDPTSVTSSYFSVRAATSSISFPSMTSMTRGATKTITWTYVGTISTVNISLVRSGIATQIASRVDSTSASPSWDYDVPAMLVSSSLYQVRITAVDYDPAQDPTTALSSYFSVVAATSSIAVSASTVSGGMIRGAAKTVAWTSVGSIDTVNITLLSSGTVSRVIALDAPNTGSFVYAVPSTLPESSNYQVRVVASKYSLAHDPTFGTSSYFSVASPSSGITMVKPTSGTHGGVSYAMDIQFTCTGFVTAFNVEYVTSGLSAVLIAGNLTGVVGTDGQTVTGTTTWTIPASIEPTSSGRIRVTASIYNAALATAPQQLSSYFSVLSAADYAKEQAGDGGGGSSSGGGGGGGGAAAAIIVVLVVLGGAGTLYKRHKAQAAQRDMEKMQGINEGGQAVRVPLPAEQYVTEGIPLCYYASATMAPASAPPQPDSLVVPVLLPVSSPPVSPMAATSPSAHYSEHAGLMPHPQ